MAAENGTGNTTWAYSPKEMLELHRRAQSGLPTAKIVDEAVTQEASNTTEDGVLQQRAETLMANLEKKIEDQTIQKRVDSILNGVLQARGMSRESITDKDIQRITEQITDLYRKKFPQGPEQEAKGLQTLQDVTQQTASFNQGASDSFEFFLEAQSLVRQVIDRHDIEREVKNVEKHRIITDTILTKDDLQSIYTDQEKGKERLYAALDPILRNGKFDRYLQTVAEAQSELEALFNAQTAKQEVWDFARRRLEEIFSTITASWNVAINLALQDYQSAKMNGNTDPQYFPAVSRLHRYIHIGEQLLQAHDTKGKLPSILVSLRKETLEKARQRLAERG